MDKSSGLASGETRRGRFIRTINKGKLVILRTHTNGVRQEVPLVPRYLSTLGGDIKIETVMALASE